MSNTHNERSVTDKNLEKGGKDFEVFWLRPKKMTNKEAILRLHINKRWGGWKLKDGLVESLGVGADWLLDNDVGMGSIIDAKVRFVYAKAPVGGIEGRDIWKLSLVFVEGYAIIEERCADDEENDSINLPSIKLPTHLDLSSLLE